VKTLILGASGLAGSAVCKLMIQKRREVLNPSSHELNLLDISAVREYFHSNDIDSVYFLAAKVGGAPANSARPLEFLLQNLQMETNVLETALQKRIPRLIFLASSTIYPEFSPYPHKEEGIFSGELSPSVRPYALAKLVGMEIVKIAVEKYELSWISVIPANLYGTGDNFRIHESHVVASIIRKIWESKVTLTRQIEVLGHPNNGRDFLFSNDLAAALYFLEQNYFGNTAVNIGPGKITSVGALVSLLTELMSYRGEIKWNATQVSGTARKVLDNRKLVELGFSSFVELRIGLSEVLRWLEDESKFNFRNIRWA